MPLKLAFLGTGLMGAPMVRNLLSAGFPVTIWNRSPDKMAPLAEAGAVIAQSPAQAAAAADVVITMVSDGAAVRALLDGGVSGAMKPGAVFVDMSSIKPREARAHFDLLKAKGVSALDAPVSGGTKGAMDATLAIMAGGEEEAFERARPVLSAMGRPTLVGPPGTGQLAKLANQGIVATTIGIVAEAMLMMQAAGADMNKLREALKGGFADSVILQQHGKRMADNDFTPGGRSSLQLKDLNNLLEEAASLGLTLPLSELQQTRYHRFVHEMGGADLDHSGLFLELKDRQDKPPVALELTGDEALVIFETLSRWAEPVSAGPPDEIFAHSSEKQALHKLLCVLETKLVEPFHEDYRDRLEAARSRLPEFPYPF